MAKLLAIVVTYDGIKWIDRCIGSLMTSGVPVDVMMIDNGSCDGTVSHVKSSYSSVMVVESGTNLGFGAANNIGLRYAADKGYDYVYLLNQDAWVMPDTFEKLMEAMQSHPQYGILSPVQMAASMDEEDARFRDKCMKPGHVYEEGGIYDVSFVMAAHWMISRKCLDTVGGFSPAFPHYGEDDNYVHRTLYHGFRVGFLMGAKAVHDRENRPYVRDVAMRRKLIIAKTKISDPGRTAFLQLLFQPFEMAAVALYHASWTVFMSIFQLFRSYPSLLRYRRQSKGLGAFL